MQQYTDIVQDRFGNAVRGVAVSVMQNGALSTLYADRAGTTPAANPVTSQPNGRFTFFAAAGNYDLYVAGQLQESILLIDPAGTGGGTTSSGYPARTSPPTTGSYPLRAFIPNLVAPPQGPLGAQYIVDGWELQSAGPPLVWIERRISVAPMPGAPAPSPAPTTAPSPSPATPYSLKVPAQNATLHNIALVQIIAGYEGTGHADWFRSGSDEWIQFTFSPTNPASGNLTLRYANYGAQTITLLLNGATTGTQIALPSSGGNWATIVVPGVSLISGTNTARLVPIDSGYSYINWAQFDQTTSAPPPPPAPAPSPTPAPSPAPSPAPAPGSAPFYPFGARTDLTAGAYPFGIKPTTSAATMDAAIKVAYDKWKLARLAKTIPFTPTSGILAGQRITNGYHDQWETTDEATRSEGMGYAMLIVVLMAGYDANAQSYFDGLLSVVRGCPAYGMNPAGGANVYLMDYRIMADMSSGGGGYSAADGDMDIILALLMAHRQWGSAGTWNYYQQALLGLTALKAADFRNAPGTTANGVMYAPQNVSRVSDYMPGHFRSFKKATNDTFWDDARTNSLTLAQNITTNYSATAHLQPGFIYDPFGANPRPDTVAHIDRSFIEQIYDENSVRNPLRWATDFVWSGDSGWGTLAKNIALQMQTASGGSANNFSWAYNLDGTPYQANLYHDGMQAACVMAGCMTHSSLQTFLDTLYASNVGAGYDTDYFYAELMLMALILVSGNWWRP